MANPSSNFARATARALDITYIAKIERDLTERTQSVYSMRQSVKNLNAIRNKEHYRFDTELQRLANNAITNLNNKIHALKHFTPEAEKGKWLNQGLLHLGAKP